MTQYEPNFTEDENAKSEGAVTPASGEGASGKKGTSKLKRNAIIVAGVVIVLGAGAYFASKRGLSEAALSQVVDSWIEEQEQRAKQDGTEVDIAYDAIHLEGSFSDHHIVIEKPAMRVAPDGLSLAQAGDQITTFATDRIILYPETTTLERVRIELPDALRIYNNGVQNPTMKIKANTPLMFAVAQDNVDGKLFTTVNHYLPNLWLIEYLSSQEASGDEEQTPVLTPSYTNYSLTLNEGGQYHSRILSGGELGEAALKFSGFTLVDASQATVFTLADFNGEWKGVIDENSHELQSLKITAGEANAGDALPELKPYMPAKISVNANMGQLQPLEGAPETASSTIAVDALDLVINTTSLNATGGFEAGAEEILPVGKADIRIDNLAALVSQLQQDGVISVSDVRIVQGVANAVLGEGNDLTGAESFTVERTRGGAFMIGKVPFEALVATVLRSAMEGVTIKTPQGTVIEDPKKAAKKAATKGNAQE